MGPANISVLPITLDVVGEVLAQRFVGVDLAQAGAGDNTYGVAAASGTDEPTTVDVLGVVSIESGAAVTANGLVESDASGRAIDRTAGAISARAIDGAAGAGEFIRCVLISN
jgi:hypothetical protein